MSINLEELKKINDLLNQKTKTDLLIVTKNRKLNFFKLSIFNISISQNNKYF